MEPYDFEWRALAWEDEDEWEPLPLSHIAYYGVRKLFEEDKNVSVVTITDKDDVLTYRRMENKDKVEEKKDCDGYDFEYRGTGEDTGWIATRLDQIIFPGVRALLEDNAYLINKVKITLDSGGKLTYRKRK